MIATFKLQRGHSSKYRNTGIAMKPRGNEHKQEGYYLAEE